jgi:tripartite-type tricarboxylate transporter receptor subunit TctC
MNNEVAGFYLSGQAPAQGLEDIVAGREIKVGSNGAASDPHMFAVAANAILHTRLKIIPGYPGMNEILLGMSRGELDGVLGYSWGVARMGSADQLKNGELKLILQLALHKHKELPAVPLVTDLIPAGEGRQVLELIFSRQSMGRPVVAPPGLRRGVAAALRKGFADVMNDPAFIEETAKINLETSFVSGEEVQELVAGLYRLPDSVVSQAQNIVGTK